MGVNFWEKQVQDARTKSGSRKAHSKYIQRETKPWSYK